MNVKSLWDAALAVIVTGTETKTPTTKTIDKTHLTYIVGAKLTNLDAWDKKTYGSELLVFRCNDFTDTQLSEITFSNKQTPMVMCVSTNEYTLIGLTSNPTMNIEFSNIFFNDYITEKDRDGDGDTDGKTNNEDGPPTDIDETVSFQLNNTETSKVSSINIEYNSGYTLKIDGYDSNEQKKSATYKFIVG